MDFYIILGVQPGASVGDIKRAYRRLARKYHPDINPGDRAAEARFRRIVEAYETLSDPDRRRQYDMVGWRHEPDGPAVVEFEGFDFSVTADGPQASTFSELFADVLSGGPELSQPVAGTDLHATISLSFEDAIRGGERHVTVTRQHTCVVCRGAGVIRTPEGRCLQCQGLGSLRWARGHMVFAKTCAPCGGTGRQRQQRCHGCGGDGVNVRSEAVAVRVPPGVADGARLRVPHGGHAGRRGGGTGDLFITVRVGPHPLFHREGEDLFLVVPVAVHEAALGARIDVPTIDGGPGRLRIPPGTQSGQRFRLRGRGVPAPDGRAGDLVVEVRLVLPPLLDERSKALMREFGQINDADVRRDCWKTS
jgi:molecular chaperone DnaJ